MTVVIWPPSVIKAVDVANKVENTVDVEGLRVAIGAVVNVLVIVVTIVDPAIDIVDVFVDAMRVAFTVIVVVPAARASRPRRKRRTPAEGSQVTVVFFVVVL